MGQVCDITPSVTPGCKPVRVSTATVTTPPMSVPVTPGGISFQVGGSVDTPSDRILDTPSELSFLGCP